MFFTWGGLIMLVMRASVSAEPMKPFECVGKGDINSTEAALKSSLFCNTNYNPRYRPVKYQQDRLAMYIGAEVINVERTRHEEARLEVTLELLMQWYDDFLNWKRSSHNIETINVSEHNLWTPTFAVKSFQKSTRDQSTKQCTNVKCHLSYDGEVIYTVLCTFLVDCYSEARYWAFDTKICTLRIYSSEYDTNQLSLFHFQRRLSYPSYPLLPYKITSFQMATVNSTMSPEFRMDIAIERMVGSHLVVFIVFIVLLVLINLLTPWIWITSSARAITCTVTVVLHTLYMILLYWYGSIKMKPVLTLAHLLLCSFLLAVFFTAWTYYARFQTNRPEPNILQRRGLIHFMCVLRKNRLFSMFLSIGYFDHSNKQIEELSCEWGDTRRAYNTGRYSSSVTQMTDTDTPPANTDGNQRRMELNLLMQAFDRILFCIMLTAYTLLLFVYAI
ncbi:proton-gated ion channel subunit pbo-6-like [Anopheles aquasalis]|uniref:proton-gated ion channel subunit pbo-6-like n=1 Tax=Anopheles aquasalis TaxID=42839 RepID=UPI00215AF6B1|nr:proton-gated ion channel subunit pbo-6-like [Anopheles aquasalis]